MKIPATCVGHLMNNRFVGKDYSMPADYGTASFSPLPEFLISGWLEFDMLGRPTLHVDEAVPSVRGIFNDSGVFRMEIEPTSTSRIQPIYIGDLKLRCDFRNIPAIVSGEYFFSLELSNTGVWTVVPLKGGD